MIKFDRELINLYFGFITSTVLPFGRSSKVVNRQRIHLSPM